MDQATGIALTFFFYLIAVLMIGYYGYQRTKNATDYYLGGRQLSSGVAALSACASDMSAWLLLGLPGYAYVSGLEASWMAAGLLAGTALNWTITAKRLRLYTYKLDDALTIPTFLERRFADHWHLLRSIAAFFILLFFLFYTSSGLVAGGKLFSTVFGLPYAWAVMIGTLAIISYTLFGGFLAVSWTDLLQGLLMAAALVVVPVIAIESVGGIRSVHTGLVAHNPELINIWTDKLGNPLGAVTIVGLLGWGLGYFGQPHILARFKAIQSHRQIPSARRIAVSWSAITLFAAIVVGLVGKIHFPSIQEDPERIFMVLVHALFHPLVAGILLAAILSAIMSTADSQLLVASSALAEDFFRALWPHKADPVLVVRVGRGAVVTIALVAMMLALDPRNKVLDLVAYAWAGFGAAFGPVIIGSLFWRRMTWQGALAGMLTGGATVVIWKHLSGGLFELYEIIPGFLLAASAIVIASLLSKKPPPQVTQPFDQVISELSE
ncbi:MAG: sodium/proline symporter PutP [Deltaproteobacteria bacterium]|nr:sodium/proline symporter PutP [Deltaproteobacteria bacterium]